ncbi:MAG: glutamate carboxypeptidase [Glaciecola sp.]
MTFGTVDLDALRDHVREREAAYRSLLETAVNIDSGSVDAAGVNAYGDFVEAQLDSRGWMVERLACPDRDGVEVGRMLVARRAGTNPDGRRVLLLAHLDTVFEVGEAARRPFSVDGTIGHGPGVSDDKSGMAAAIVAVDALVAAGADSYAEVVLAMTPDEELGSPSSAHLVAAVARSVDVAFCLEAARANGDLVSARKGIADLQISITGRAAHAGIEPEKGAHALLQASYVIQSLQELNGFRAGVTCNVGVCSAGRRPNIVPEVAVLEVDIRAWTVADFDEAMAEATRRVEVVHVEGTSSVIKVLAHAPPMEKTPEVARLAEQAQAIAAALGFEVRDAATGGAADANTVAAQGVPVLDGMAPIGGDDHALTEWLDLASVVDRVSLLAAMVADQR